MRQQKDCQENPRLKELERRNRAEPLSLARFRDYPFRIPEKPTDPIMAVSVVDGEVYRVDFRGD